MSFPENLKIRLLEPDTVITAAAVLIHPKAVRKLRRRHTPALLTLLHFQFCLGIVHPHRRFQLPRKICHTLHQLPGSRVFRVKSHQERRQITQLPDNMVVFLHQLHRTAVIIESARLHRPESRVRGRPGIHRREEIHIKIGRDATCQILHNSQNIQPVYIILRELALARENLPVEPVLQRKIIRIGAQKCHRRVRVCVFKSRHQQAAFHVSLTVPDRNFRTGHAGRRRISRPVCFPVPDITDRISLYPEFSRHYIKFMIFQRNQNLCIVKSCIHIRPRQPLSSRPPPALLPYL